jgi:MscS family membrane protein
MVDILDRIFYGNTLENWGNSLIIIVSALVLNKLIALLTRQFIRKMTAKTDNKYNGALIKSIVSPILLGIMLLAIWIAAIRLHWSKEVLDNISKSYNILIILNFTWLFVRLVGALLDEHIRRMTEKNKAVNLPVDNKLMPLIRRTIVLLIWVIGIVTALSNAKVDVAALLGALGIGGFAIALAAQDTVKNIISGITLFTDRPFKIGDRIRFDAIDGNVEDIGVRSTKIRTLDGRIITISNSKIVDASIENVSVEPRRRMVLQLRLANNTSPEKMKEAIAILKSIPQTIKEIESKDLSAFFSDFEDTSLIITFTYFIRKSAPDITEAISKVNFEILNRFKEANINFAFPAQKIFIDK